MLKREYLPLRVAALLLITLALVGLKLMNTQAGRGDQPILLALPYPAAATTPTLPPLPAPTATALPPLAPTPTAALPEPLAAPPTATPLPADTPTPPPTNTPEVVSINLDAPNPPFIPTHGEHWAEVSLGGFKVTLYSGAIPQMTFPMSYGRGDTPNSTTYPGLFHVYAKDASLHESIIKGSYIRNWVGFDSRWANGFHSIVMDRNGEVLDDRLGLPISSGCIRTALDNSTQIFDWLPLGARVWVHD